MGRIVRAGTISSFEPAEGARKHGFSRSDKFEKAVQVCEGIPADMASKTTKRKLLEAHYEKA
jgi:hypothetical protein